ncbi:MAG: LD-carboxypeptidase [Deltaproteobacteria bacterium]|jgi:muramoyltetrapeptide carboxypeptidase|nr:LD-carboxypeptidase [Deltaproteobacteria bacterium]
MEESGWFLKQGSTLGLFAPASPYEPTAINSFAKMAEETGFKFKRPFILCRPKGYLAGTDQERQNCLSILMADPEIHGLLAIRGGYGCMRLLQKLEKLWVFYPPKPIIGYSDITALHLARLAATGTGGWHAPMLINMDLPGHRQRLAEILAGDLKPWKFVKKGCLKNGHGRGKLIGGNLSVIVSLLATPYWPDPTGTILLLEDTGENLYRLDRLLTSLRLSGVLEKLVGLIFGDFGRKILDKQLKPILRELAEVCPGPVAWGPYFGHGLENRPWPVGSPGQLTVTSAGGTLEFL